MEFHAPHASAIGRVTGLDELRGIAILLVAGLHFAEFITAHVPSATRLPGDMPIWVPWSSIGVDLFFVISGFLITTILISTKSGDYSGCSCGVASYLPSRF
jgi:peptidoglycan/LPS O-acetylase OafA/YrhL